MHPTHDDLVLHYYGESGDETARLDLHLATCAECRDALQRLQQALALVEASGEGEPSPGYEATLWARLQDQIVEAPQPWWRALWPASAGRWAVATGMAAVAAVAFFAGWQARDASQSAASQQAAVVGDPVDGAEPTRARLLDLAVRDHLDRAQLVLAEVTNGEADAFVSLEGERQRATDLVATNRLVRQSATLAGDESLDAVLDDLERVLVDIANAPDDLTADDWAALRARIETQSLLFRVRVLADELRVRPRPAATLRKGTTS